MPSTNYSRVVTGNVAIKHRWNDLTGWFLASLGSQGLDSCVLELVLCSWRVTRKDRGDVSVLIRSDTFFATKNVFVVVFVAGTTVRDCSTRLRCLWQVAAIAVIGVARKRTLAVTLLKRYSFWGDRIAVTIVSAWDRDAPWRTKGVVSSSGKRTTHGFPCVAQRRVTSFYSETREAACQVESNRLTHPAFICAT